MREGMRSRDESNEDVGDHDQRDRVVRELEQMGDELFWKRVYVAAVGTSSPNPAWSADEAIKELKARRARNWEAEEKKAPDGESSATD